MIAWYWVSVLHEVVRDSVIGCCVVRNWVSGLHEVVRDWVIGCCMVRNRVLNFSMDVRIGGLL